MPKELLKVAKGDTLVIHSHYGRGDTVQEVTVVKVGRVWVEVKGQYGPPRKYRMDDRTDGSGYSQHGMIYTQQEWARKQATDEARQRVHAHGVRLQFDSPWDDRIVELADLLDNATPQEGK